MILKQNRIGRDGRVKNKASFFTRPFCVTGSFGEFPATQKELTCDGAHLRADGRKLQIFSEKFFCVPEHDALRQFL